MRLAKKLLDFSADMGHDTDPEICKECLPLRENGNNWRNCRRIRIKMLRGGMPH